MPASTVVRPALQYFSKPTRTHILSLSFLAPFLHQTTSFSTSTPNALPRDYNRDRGVSSVRRTGPRQPLSVSKESLPTPVLDPSKRSKVIVDENHGLWDFFHSKEKPMNTPEEDDAHGRPWKPQDLRSKSWEDLHALWWVCAKERNRIATETYERDRLKAGYGEFEARKRDKDVKRTQRAIKQVLTERYYSWEDARKLARDDPEVDLSGNGPPYFPPEIPQEELYEDEEFTKEDMAAAERAEEDARSVKPPRDLSTDGLIPPSPQETAPAPPVR